MQNWSFNLSWWIIVYLDIYIYIHFNIHNYTHMYVYVCSMCVCSASPNCPNGGRELDSKNAPNFSCMYVVCLRIFWIDIILHVYIDINIMQYDMSYYHCDHVWLQLSHVHDCMWQGPTQAIFMKTCWHLQNQISEHFEFLHWRRIHAFL